MVAVVVAVLIGGAAIVGASIFRRVGDRSPVPDDPEAAEAQARAARERVRAAQTDAQRERERGWPF